MDEKLEEILVESPPDPESIRKLGWFLTLWVMVLT